MRLLSEWCRSEYSGPCVVDTLCDGNCGKAPVSLIRQLLPKLTGCENIVVIEGNVVTDLALRAQMLAHEMKEALLTMVVGKAPVETGDSAKSVAPTDYFSIQPDGVISVYCHAQEKLRDVRIAEACLSKHVHLTIRKDCRDMKTYIFRRNKLSSILEENPGLTDIQKHLIPYLVRYQLVSSNKVGNSMATLDRTSSTNLTACSGSESHLHLQSMKHDSQKQAHAVIAYRVPQDVYCELIDSLASYSSANRDVLAPHIASKFIDLKPNARSDAFIDSPVEFGNKVTVGNGSIVGRGSTLGDRSSIKRSVVGASCHIGASSKIINCVIHDGVSIGEGCHIQNSIICCNAVIASKISMKDCQVGAGVTVADPGNYKSEEFFD